MKTLFVILLNVLSTLACAQGSWMPLTSGTTRNLTALSFPDPFTGYVVGERGTILKTSNAGLSWTSQFQDTTRNFSSVYFVNPVQGYALSAHRLYGTQDGGNSWQALYTDSSVNLYVVHFVNAATGFIGTDSTILKTINSGQSWTIVKSTVNPITSISFPTPSTGYFTGGSGFQDQMYKTTDQGQNFTGNILNMQSIKERVYFLNDTVGYFTGWYAGALQKTTNGGKSWNTINSINDTQGWDVHFSNELNGFYINNSGGTSKIYRSTDGGNTWVQDATASWNTYLKFAFTSTGKGFAVGKNGGIYSKHFSVGIEDFAAGKTLSIYPNPNSGTFRIRSDRALGIQVTDQPGRNIANTQLNQMNAYTCELSELPQGVYFLKASYGEHSENYKIVVQR